MLRATFIEEFQYLGEDAKELVAVASELNAAWEQPRAPRPLVLVISGSAVRMLEGLDSGGAPLHGRFAWKCQLTPFNYWHAAQMASFRSTRDRALAYGIFGGTPLYLDKIKPGNPVADNVKRLMLSKMGEVRSLVETAILQEQGLRDITKYQAILRAIGAGNTELNPIALKVGLPNDTGLRDKIDRLVDRAYISAARNYGVAPNAPLRYRIKDPAFAFYYEFVSPNFAALERRNRGFTLIPLYTLIRFWGHNARQAAAAGHVIQRHGFDSAAELNVNVKTAGRGGEERHVGG